MPYSFVFKGDADGSGITGESLFYVPSGPNDPKVQWLSATEEANFFSYLATNPQLSKWAGQIVPRNSAYAPWQEDAQPALRAADARSGATSGSRCTRTASTSRTSSTSTRASWTTSTTRSTRRPIAGTGYNKTTNQYQYVFNAGTLGTPSIYSDLSRWQVQVGARLEF